MARSIAWSEVARGQLREITDWLKQYQPAGAGKITADILSRVRLLAAAPGMGRVHSRLGAYTVREILAGPYRVFYADYDDKNEISIVTIWHSSRAEPPAHLLNG